MKLTQKVLIGLAAVAVTIPTGILIKNHTSVAQAAPAIEQVAYLHEGNTFINNPTLDNYEWKYSVSIAAVDHVRAVTRVTYDDGYTETFTLFSNGTWSSEENGSEFGTRYFTGQWTADRDGGSTLYFLDEEGYRGQHRFRVMARPAGM